MFAITVLTKARYCKMAYVYRHIRLDKNAPFYIGLGTDDKHKRAFEKTRRSSFWKRVASKGYEVEILMDGLTKEQAAEKEIEFISLYGRIDNGTGCLVNMTDGGDGTIGKVFTPEYRAKLSVKAKGRRYSEEYRSVMNKARVGSKWTPEQCKRLSEIKRENGTPTYDHVRALRSKRMQGEANPSFGMTGAQSRSFKGHIQAFKDGVLIGVYAGIRECEEALGVDRKKVSAVILGQRNHTGGYIFKRQK
jgi:hypothetical protein